MDRDLRAASVDHAVRFLACATQGMRHGDWREPFNFGGMAEQRIGLRRLAPPTREPVTAG